MAIAARPHPITIMNVKFTRSIIAGGEHRDQGSTADLAKLEAVELIRAGDCVEVSETAEEAEPKKKSKPAKDEE